MVKRRRITPSEVETIRANIEQCIVKSMVASREMVEISRIKYRAMVE